MLPLFMSYWCLRVPKFSLFPSTNRVFELMAGQFEEYVPIDVHTERQRYLMHDTLVTPSPKIRKCQLFLLYGLLF